MIKKTKAIILKNMDYKNTSKIVNVFSQDFGRISIVTKGVKKAKDNLLYNIQPVTMAYVTFYYHENSDIFDASQIDLIDDYTHIKENISRYQFACAGMELINRFMETGHEELGLFGAAARFLEHLDSGGQINHIAVFFKFAALFLKYNGHLPDFGKCVICGKPFDAMEPLNITGGGEIACCKADSPAVIQPGDFIMLKKIIFSKLDDSALAVPSQNQVTRLLNVLKTLLKLSFHKDWNTKTLQTII